MRGFDSASDARAFVNHWKLVIGHCLEARMRLSLKGLV